MDRPSTCSGAVGGLSIGRLSGALPFAGRLVAAAGPFGGFVPEIGPGGEAGVGVEVRNALIVEDEFLTSWHLSDMMSGLGFRVVGVSATGEDAIRLASETEPDVILMDVSLKGTLDGVEAAQVIRNERQVPIVFVTAYTDDETVKRMEGVGGTWRISKPVTVRDLQGALGSAMSDD